MIMNISPVAFSLFAGMALFFSVLTIFQKNPARSAFSLVMVFFCFAAIYALMNAHLIAALQVLVYTGAVMVLFIFVIMLLSVDQESNDRQGVQRWMDFVTGLAGLGICLLLAFSFFRSRGAPPLEGSWSQGAITQSGGNTKVLSSLLFSKWILPFEVTSLLLLTAIVGSVSLAKRRLPKRLISLSRSGVKK
jgi:NADH-quinone oxidoreductase subunit J